MPFSYGYVNNSVQSTTGLTSSYTSTVVNAGQVGIPLGQASQNVSKVNNVLTVGQNKVDVVSNNPFNGGSGQYTKIGGLYYDKEKQKETINVLKATESLVDSLTAKNTNIPDPGLQTINFFESLGCTVLSDPGVDYSMIPEQTNASRITNPNIGTSISNRKNSKVSANKSFVSDSDPFYQPDRERSSGVKQQEVIVKNVISGLSSRGMASYIANLNLSSNNPNKLKQFKAPETKSTNLVEVKTDKPVTSLVTLKF